MDNKPNVTCNVCGENDYHLKEGYYYCNECGTKTEQVRAVVVERDDEFEDAKHKKTQKIKSDKSNKPELTSWECYNYILRGLVEELLAIGAKDDLKLMVLQIWAAYLRHMEVAFFNNRHVELPKLGVRFEPRDASILYNHCKEKKKIKSEEKKTSSIASSRREWRKQVKKLDQSQYEASSISQSLCSQSFLTQSSLGDTSILSSGSGASNRVIRLKFSSVARKHFKKKMPAKHLKKHEQDGDQSLTCHNIRPRIKDLKYKELTMELNIKQLYAIIGIALNLIEDEIQLTDLMRFAAEKHIFSANVERFFPENISEHCKENLSSIRFHNKHMIFSVASLREQCSLLCKAIHISKLKRPNIAKLVQRYISELCLPTELYTYIERLINLHPPQMDWDNRTLTPAYESRAMAYIIFTLKLLFGLDGRKEKQISKSAKKVNAKLPELELSNYNDLFVWDNWVEYIEMRKVILCNHCLTMCQQFKEIPPRELYLQSLGEQCKMAETGLSKVQKKKQENMEIVFKHFLQITGNALPTDHEEEFKFGPSFTPCSNYFKRIQLDSRIRDVIPDFMQVDHSKRIIEPFIRPGQLIRTFEDCSQKLEVVRLACSSKRNLMGTFRNPILWNKRNFPQKIQFGINKSAWEAKVDENKPAGSIFKPVMEKYCDVSLKTMREKDLKREKGQGEALPEDAVFLDDISLNKSIDIFDEDDMEPADISLLAPRRNLERLNLFANVSDDEICTQADSETSQVNLEKTTLKISNMDCWVLMGKTHELTEVQLAELKNQLPTTFFWLLEMCANTLGVDWTELYDEVMVLETFFGYVIEPLDRFEDRIIFKGENEIKDINKIVRHFKPWW